MIGKKILSIALLAIGLLQVGKSQVSERVDVNASLQSNHLWRGLIITDKPIVSGNLSIALDKDKKWSTGVWGASSLSDDSDGTHYKEINYYVQYSDGRFYIGLWDLYNARNINTSVASENVFNYKKKSTTHILDLRMNYTFGPAFPLNVETDIMLYGGANAGEVILDNEGNYDKNRYSTYAQLSYPVVRDKQVNLETFVGAGFALNNKSFLYSASDRSFDIVNVGAKASKSLKFSESYSLPVSMMVMWNPANNYARVQLAASLF